MFALCPLAGRDRRHAHRDRGRSRISIHAPLAGRDKPCGKWYDGYGISIHAPREGRDQTFFDALNQGQQFQSTRPARGATVSDATVYHVRLFQSTRPARGATPKWEFRSEPACISIHAPREGRDVDPICVAVYIAGISIHAPREGRDG